MVMTRTPSIEVGNVLWVLPPENAVGLCPHYDSPEEDPESPCVRDAIEQTAYGDSTVDCWENWGGPRLGFVCPFLD